MTTFGDLFHEFLMMDDWTKLLGKLPPDRKRMTNDTCVPLLLQPNNRFVTRSCICLKGSR